MIVYNFNSVKILRKMFESLKAKSQKVLNLEVCKCMVSEMEVFELKVLKLKVSKLIVSKLKVSKLKVSNLKGLSKFSPKVSLLVNICGTLFFLIFEFFDPIPLFLFVRWFGFSFVFDFPNSACLQTFSAIPTFITTGPTNTDISWGTFKQTDAIY